MKKILILALMFPALAMAAPLDQLLERLAKLDNLSGQFEQTMMDRDGSRLQEASGELVVARGNRFYWHTELPFEELAVSNGETVWVYDVDLEQVVVRPLTRDLTQTPALLFGGDPGEVGDAFVVEEQGRHGEQVTFRLFPKDSDPLFEELDVTFDGNIPRSMRLRDALGQKTVIDFLQVQVNDELDLSRFQFQPPADADVIEQR